MDAITNIFKAYDIRRKITTKLAREIGRELADWLPKGAAVAVGQDMRPDAAELIEV